MGWSSEKRLRIAPLGIGWGLKWLKIEPHTSGYWQMCRIAPHGIGQDTGWLQIAPHRI
jgi:hypothetical protein